MYETLSSHTSLSPEMPKMHEYMQLELVIKVNYLKSVHHKIQTLEFLGAPNIYIYIYNELVKKPPGRGS